MLNKIKKLRIFILFIIIKTMGVALEGKGLSFFGAQFLVLVATIVFLTGYWFLGKSSGEKECSTPIEQQVQNYGGGVAGIIIGIMLYVMSKWVIHQSSKSCVLYK